MSVNESHAIDLVDEVRRTRNELYERMEERSAQQRERLRSTSKTRKSAETRRRIMDTTSQLMMERGNTTFRMSEVSRRCEMSKGALYYYFADKEDLVAAIFDASVDDLVRGIDDVVRQAQTPREALLGISNVFATCVAEGSPLAMSLVRELLQWRERASCGVDSRIEHIVNVIASLLESAKEAGTVRQDINSHLAAIAACGAFTFGALGVFDQDTSEDEFASVILDCVVRGLEAR